jgi:hypothetical protein
MYQGFARSAGLNYWESLLYTNVGSFLWETGGETTDPSINDQFASGIGGSFFGEVLFRMASLVLEGDGGKPGFWQELGAAMISPPTGINRLSFGNRFKPIFPSHNPATFSRLQLGVSLNSDVSNDESVFSSFTSREATAAFTMAYGLPGKPGYSYRRPFDYFHFEFTTLGNADNPSAPSALFTLCLARPGSALSSGAALTICDGITRSSIRTYECPESFRTIFL